MKKSNNIIILFILIIIALVLIVGGKSIYNSYIEKEENYSETSKENKNVEAQNLKKVKSFKATTIDGSTVYLEDYVGKSPIVINFWASWCDPCTREMPHFNKLEKEYTDVTFLMVNLVSMREMPDVAKKFLEDNNFSFNNIWFDTEGEASEIYGIYSIPKTIFVDIQGNIVKEKVGTMTETVLKNEIEKIIK